MKYRTSGLRLFSFFAIVLSLVHCEPVFDPIQQSDRHNFSIYGFLDSSADTQWVRVMPVREALNRLPDTLDALVALEHVEGGDKEVMNDSLFHHGQSAAYWNFWTTMDLQPAQTYRLTAARSDGKRSSVEVVLPEDFPSPLVWTDEARVLVRGVQQLADVKMTWLIRNNLTGTEQVYSFSHLFNVFSVGPGQYRVNLNIGRDFSDIARRYGDDTENFTVLHRQVYVASAGPDWLDFAGIDDEVIALPDEVTNVENGVGYLVGIVSKTVPYQSCFDENGRHVGCPEEKPLR